MQLFQSAPNPFKKMGTNFDSKNQLHSFTWNEILWIRGNLVVHFLIIQLYSSLDIAVSIYKNEIIYCYHIIEASHIYIAYVTKSYLEIINACIESFNSIPCALESFHDLS